MKSLRKAIACIVSFMLLFVCVTIVTNAQAASTLSISSPSEWSVRSWDDSLTIRWNSVSGAAGYYVTIKNETTGGYLVQNKWTTSRSFSAGSYLPESIAKLKIWVGAVTSSSQAAVESFTSDIIYIYVSHEPGITNGSASSITETSATLSMTIDYDYGYSIDDWGFYVGTSSSVSKMTQYSYGYTAKGTKTATITGLSPNTKYYYRAYAENEVGEDYTTTKTFTTKAAPLTKPVITYPADESTFSNGQSIKLQWNAVSGASGYRYHIKQLSGSPDRTNDSEPYENYWQDTTTSTSYTLSSSRVVGGYWYKFVVEAYADGVNSTWSNWIYVWVEKETLNKPSIIYPSDNTTITAYQDIPLQWKSVSGADGYTYSIKRLSGTPDRSNDNEPGTVIADKVKTTSTSYTLPASNFVPGYWYKFVVSAYAKGAYDAWSEWVYVYAQGGGLDKAVVVSPVDTATYSAYKSIKFDWNPVANASGYKVFIKRLDNMPDRTNDNETGASIANGVSVSSGVTEYTVSASEVTPGKWYKFVVEALADGMESSWSQWTYCYVDESSLGKAEITTPATWSQATAGKSLTVKWNSVSGANGYWIYWKQLSGTPDTSNDNEPAVFAQDKDCKTALNYTVSSDKIIGGYWYKFVVKAYATSKQDSWSNWVYVYVPENGDLDRPIITSPVVGQNYEAGRDIRFTWAKVDNATSYTYYIKQLVGEPDYSDNELAANSWTGTTRATGRSYTLSGSNVQPNTWYKFVVKAEGSGYNSSWSRYTYIKIPDREDWIHFIMPAAMTSVSEQAFEGNALLRTFDASESQLYEIEDKAFANCVNLKSINLPASVSYIADNAFYNCPSLTIHCITGSYAEEFAISKGIPVEVHGLAVEADMIKLSQTDWTISTTDAAYTIIRVNSSLGWTASSNASWVTLDKKSGTDGENVLVNASKNTTNNSRTATVTFTCGNAKAELTVVQNPSPSQDCIMKVYPTFWEPSSNALTREIIVENNAGFTVSSDSAWLTYDVNNATITAKVTSASLTSSQKGTLTITCSDCGAIQTVTVSTKGNYVPAPSNVTVATIDTESLRVTWSDVTGASYVIERAGAQKTDWQQVATISAGSDTQYTDNGLAAGTQYYYRVYARKVVSGSTITSEASTPVGNTTNGQDRLYFTGQYASDTLPAGGRASLAKLSTLSWTTTDGVTTYKVSLRNLATNQIVGDWDQKSVGNVNAVSFASALSEGVSYRVWVGAYNTYGHLIGQTSTLDFTVSSKAATPTLSIDSISPSQIKNDGNSYFAIAISATNAHTFVFDFGELMVWEGWDKEHVQKEGYKTYWVFDGDGDFGDKWTYEKLNSRSTSFYPVADSPVKTYTIAVKAIGDGGETEWKKINVTLTDKNSPVISKYELTDTTIRAGALACLKLETNKVASFSVKIDDAVVEAVKETFNPTENRAVSILLPVPENMSVGRHKITIVYSSEYEQNDSNSLSIEIPFTVKQDGWTDFSWPTPGYKVLSSHYGNRIHPIQKIWKPHGGIDISAPDGNPIYAVADGKVSFVEDNDKNTGWGYYVKIDHGNGITTLYAHMNSKSTLSIGAEVKKGETVLGYVGMTGSATAPHLHLEVYENGVKHDPIRGYFNHGITNEVYTATKNSYNYASPTYGNTVQFYTRK